VPKPLLVFLLGPLDNAQLAFAVSALAGALFGALVYLIAKRVFGRTIAFLCSLVLLLDVDRATLTARASADFFVGLFLYASIWLALERRSVVGASRSRSRRS
jgi:4-amino-4-deoxy-L-arabinose transferase-like glycosyltransferase